MTLVEDAPSTAWIHEQIAQVRTEIEQAQQERTDIEKQVADTWDAPEPDAEAMRHYSTLLARIGGGAERIRRLEALLPEAERREAFADLETATVAAEAGYRELSALDKKIRAAQQRLNDLISEKETRKDEASSLNLRRIEAEKRCRQVGCEPTRLLALAEAHRVEGYL